MRYALVTVLAASFLSAPVSAKLISTHTTAWMDVSGSTPAGLMQAILATTGDGSLANTGVEYRILYKIREDGDQCRLHDVRVFMDVTVELPRWEERSRAEPAFGKRFDRFVEALAAHEDGHVRLFHQQANQLDMALQVLRKPCGLIDAFARQLPSRLEETYNRLQEDYDSRTADIEDPADFTLY